MKKVLIISLIVVLVIASAVWIVFIFKSKPYTQAQKLYSQSLKLIEEGKIEEASFNLEKIISEFSTSVVADEALLNLAKLKIKSGKLLQAKKLLKMSITLCPDTDKIDEIQRILWDVNMRILFSPIKTQGTVVYEIKKGDTLYRIAKRFNTTVELIKKSNGIKNSSIRPGDKLKIVTDEFSVVVDKSKNTLSLKEGEEVLKIYTVSTGENNSTPVGTFKITNKLMDPPWYRAGAVVAAESPDNILGSRWMGLSVKGYGIHGTTQPETIGRQVTEGCVRMRNKDVEELYSILPVGAEVVIVN